MTIAESIRRKRGALLVWGALAAVVLLIFVFAATKRPPEKNVAEGEKAVPVRTVVVEPQDVADVIQLPGRIEPLQAANLAAQRAGQVVELLVAKGETVAEGQALLRLDSRLWAAARRRGEQLLQFVRFELDVQHLAEPHAHALAHRSHRGGGA